MYLSFKKGNRLKSVYPKKNSSSGSDLDSIFEGRETKCKKQEEIEQIINSEAMNTIAVYGRLPVFSEETTVTKTKKHEIATIKDDDKKIVIHYISDLHLTHKIIDKLENTESLDGNTLGEAAIEEIELAVAQIAKSIKYRNNSNYEKVVLIGGDVSEYFEITRAFYYHLSKEIGSRCTILSILGNHELWDGDPNGTDVHDVQKIINEYRDTINEFDISMLENSIYARVNGRSILISEEMLYDDSIYVYLKRILSKAEIIVFGSIGFSGNNAFYNASTGLYRNTVSSLEKDKQLSERCNAAYYRAVDLIGTNQFICLTHNPKTDWSDNLYLSNCIYINGHTHNNNYTIEDNKRILADNQVGYKGKDYSLKYFALSGSCDYFQYMPDGIHEIHPVEYIEFAELKGYRYRYKRNDSSKMNVLEKSGFYMFVTQNKSSVCILHGGRKERLPRKKLDYFYENMDVLAEQLLISFKGYEERIHEISKFVKKMGGDGKVHGCIVDIDFYNHVYLNPFDGTVTSYCAPNMMSRISYPSLQLLIDKNPSHSPVLNGMKKLLKSEKTKNELITITNIQDRKKETYSKGTYIYKVSNKVKKVQNLFDGNIIQIWDDEILNTVKSSLIKY